MRYLFPVLIGGAFSVPAFADAPKVVADIAPVHGLVSQVMGDLGTPDLLMRQGSSPHGYAMRPSEAAALQSADLVVWVGHDLTLWLDEKIDTLAHQAHHLALSEAEGTNLLPYRETAVFDLAEEDDHASSHDDHEAEHHDDHEEDAHGHDESHDEGHDHAHGANDPHSWLDPKNAQAWLGVIADELAEIDPENAETYRANAAQAAAEIAEKSLEVEAALAAQADLSFVVFHDAYQYFENSFGLTATGAISAGDAADPGPARVAEVQNAILEQGVTCVFSEPQYNPKLVNAIADNTDIKSVVIDPLGAELDLGTGFYTSLLDSMAGAFQSCSD